MENVTDTRCDKLLLGVADPPSNYDAAPRYVISVILVLFPIVTLAGNSFVVVAVATHTRLRTITNAFVVSLAIADCMVALLVMPFGIYQQLNNRVWLLGPTLCLVTTSFDVMFTTTSIFHLSCLAIDRFLAICKPFIHERLTNTVVALMLIFCWVVPAFISFLPILNGWNLVGIEDFYDCAFPPDDPTHCAFVVNIPFATVCSLIAFYIPTVFMIVCNVKIYLAARKQAHQIRSLEISTHRHHRKGKLKQETKAAKTIGIIMGCFCICWFPFFIFNIVDPIVGYKIPYVPWTVALWLGYINSMMNPFLYYNFNKQFNVAFRRLLTFKVCRGVSEYEDDYIRGISTTTHFTDLPTYNHTVSNGRE